MRRRGVTRGHSLGRSRRLRSAPTSTPRRTPWRARLPRGTGDTGRSIVGRPDPQRVRVSWSLVASRNSPVRRQPGASCAVRTGGRPARRRCRRSVPRTRRCRSTRRRPPVGYYAPFLRTLSSVRSASEHSRTVAQGVRTSPWPVRLIPRLRDSRGRRRAGGHRHGVLRRGGCRPQNGGRFAALPPGRWAPLGVSGVTRPGAVDPDPVTIRSAVTVRPIQLGDTSGSHDKYG